MPDRTTAAEIMTRSLITFTPETDVYTAMHTLLDKRISGAPVVDGHGKLVGVLSEKDCLRVLKAGAFDGLPEGRVGDYMSREVHTARPSTGLFDIVSFFLDRPYRRLPVVDDDGELVGQISRRDALRAIESIRENSFLYGSKEQSLKDDDGMSGVDSAMRVARGL